MTGRRSSPYASLERVEQLGEDAHRYIAAALAEQITSGAIDDGMMLRDVYRAQRSGVRNAAEARAGAGELKARGWLRLERTGKSGLSIVIRLRPNLVACLAARRGA